MSSTKGHPRIGDDARRHVEGHPLVKQAYSLCALVAHTLDRLWRPDPDIPYGGEARTEDELREARDLIPVRAYLKDLHERLTARARRRAEAAYVEYMRRQTADADKLAA
ncbi:MAG TPA: hypothetical protein VF668_01365 [Pyrinomonadaceae bacterium]|jgi:hypothetical protein